VQAGELISTRLLSPIEAGDLLGMPRPSSVLTRTPI
jgi:hypothetical protein